MFRRRAGSDSADVLDVARDLGLNHDGKTSRKTFGVGAFSVLKKADAFFLQPATTAATRTQPPSMSC